MLTVPKPAKALEFQLEGAPEIYEIPYPGGLGLNYARRLQALGTADPDERAVAFMDLLVDVLNEYAPGAADRLSAEGLGVILAAWTGRDGEGLGE